MFNGQPSGAPSFASFYGAGPPYSGGQSGMAPTGFASHPLNSGAPPQQFYGYGEPARSCECHRAALWAFPDVLPPFFGLVSFELRVCVLLGGLC